MTTHKQSPGMINEYFGLSSDEKPKDPPNASTFYEMDTQSVYMYDKENQTWIKQ